MTGSLGRRKTGGAENAGVENAGVENEGVECALAGESGSEHVCVVCTVHFVYVSLYLCILIRHYALQSSIFLQIFPIHVFKLV